MTDIAFTVFSSGCFLLAASWMRVARIVFMPSGVLLTSASFWRPAYFDGIKKRSVGPKKKRFVAMLADCFENISRCFGDLL
ncbi:hypothetical protein BX666DRAFT_662873 [Dichotomocladium elegans]|nr:hypothetical protein BX666DRAFT_662873 [Dichotomocladium elegans]